MFCFFFAICSGSTWFACSACHLIHSWSSWRWERYEHVLVLREKLLGWLLLKGTSRHCGAVPAQGTPWTRLRHVSVVIESHVYVYVIILLLNAGRLHGYTIFTNYMFSNLGLIVIINFTSKILSLEFDRWQLECQLHSLQYWPFMILMMHVPCSQLDECCAWCPNLISDGCCDQILSSCVMFVPENIAHGDGDLYLNLKNPSISELWNMIWVNMMYLLQYYVLAAARFGWPAVFNISTSMTLWQQTSG